MGKETEKVLNFLSSHGIPYRFMEHPPVYTSAEADALGLEDSERGIKNLFLRSKGNYYLLMIPQNDRADLKKLRAELGCGRMDFADEDELFACTRLTRGAVSPLGILNDDERRVTVLIDRKIADFDTVSVHTNENTGSVWLAFDDLKRVILEHGNELRMV